PPPPRPPLFPYTTLFRSRITLNPDGTLNVPANPIIPFIEGDGIGPDIWNASQRVLDAAVQKAYAGQRKISWYEVYAGEKAQAKTDRKSTRLNSSHVKISY